MITINNKEFKFSFVGFGALYFYETITGEVFSGVTTRNLHLLMYSTLLFCNREAFTLTIEEFGEWLYEHPAEEAEMAEAIHTEVLRRNALRDAKKKE